VVDVDLPEFEGDRDVREKIGEQLKSAGIDPSAPCGFEWPGDDMHAEHFCGEINPLHTQDHKCELCSGTLSHVEAEAMMFAADAKGENDGK
jgi:hypothetical protein